MKAKTKLELRVSEIGKLMDYFRSEQKSAADKKLSQKQPFDEKKAVEISFHDNYVAFSSEDHQVVVDFRHNLIQGLVQKGIGGLTMKLVEQRVPRVR